MANDLTSLFEAAGGYQALGSGPDAVYSTPNGGADGMEHAYGGDEGLSNILKELF